MNSSDNISSQCKSGCGFFSNPQFEGYCSSCYKKYGSGKTAAPTPSESNPLPVAVAASVPTSAPIAIARPTQNVADPMDVVPSPESSSPMSPSKRSGRVCGLDGCNKKLTLTSVACRCGTTYVTVIIRYFLVWHPNSIFCNFLAVKKCRRVIARVPSLCAPCDKLTDPLARICSYCASHRLAESHSCQYDYKTGHKLAIQNANPTVAHSKVEKI
jgi:hypothetical protein